MDSRSEYETRVDDAVFEWDSRIRELEKEIKFTSTPEQEQQIRDEIGSIIAAREAARRGLFRVERSGELCMDCSLEEERR
jgi:hypothetical protein